MNNLSEEDQQWIKDNLSNLKELIEDKPTIHTIVEKELAWEVVKTSIRNRSAWAVTIVGGIVFFWDTIVRIIKAAVAP